MTVSCPDGHLIARLRRGDVEALGELYEKYKERVFRTALAITRDQGAAEDILQECFLRLFTHADRVRADMPLEPWLYRVTVNLSYTWARRRQQGGGMVGNLLDRLVAPLYLLPERVVEQLEEQETVRRVLEELPLAHRVVVVLFYLEGLDLKEIADILEIPEGTVKSRLHYARETLRELLTERKPVQGMAYEFT